MIRPVLVAALVALTVSGCGSSSSSDVVSTTGKNLAKIKSGVLDLKLLVTPRSGGKPFGFELKGPFSFRPGKLPIAKIAYTQIANGTSATATFVSDGAHAWIVSSAGTRPVPEATAKTLTTSSTLNGLDIGSWIKDAKVTDAGGGADRVTGNLDVVAAANGLTGVAQLAGKTVPRIQGDDAKRLQEATRASTVDLVTTKGDRFLRRLALMADLGFDVPQTLRQALGTRVGAKIDFRLAIARPNQRVVVHAP